MTTEEKAKAYDEALEKAKVHINNKGIGDTVDLCKHLFPELRESEDERIRECICMALTDVDEQRFKDFGTTLKDCLSWLEKQKEKKPAEPSSSNNESEYDRGYRDGKAFQLEQVEQYSIGKTFMGLIPCWVDAPSTLQPAHKYHGKNAVIMHENNGGFMCCFIDDEEATVAHLPENTGFVEGWRKKPAGWSKEDEAMIKSILFVLESYVSQSESASSPSLITTYPTYYKEIDWLKSLRPSWKPSEQEKGALRTAIYVLREERNFPKAAGHLQAILDAFEGKESRKDWKPSEGQMDALRASNSYWKGTTNEVPRTDLLESLYNDLEKLIAKR